MTPTETLTAWLFNPPSDEGMDPPRPATIRRALEALKTFAADRVTAGSNGDIVLCRGDECVYVWRDSPPEYVRFEGTWAVERKQAE